MGAAISEPITQYDLGHDVWQLHLADQRKAQSIGCVFQELPVRQQLTGMWHVDDGLLCSYIWCDECLERFATRLFPRDVGITAEERGPCLRFLHTVIRCDESGHVTIEPFNPNEGFARGLEAEPKILRLARWQPMVHHSSTLQPFLLAKLLAYNITAAGSASDGARHLLLLLLEL